MSDIRYTPFINGLDSLVNGAKTDLIPVSNSTTTESVACQDLRATNDIVNGALDNWLAGTSFVSPSNADYISDMTKYFNTSSANVTASQETTIVPDGFNNSLKIDVTTASASVGAADFVEFDNYIEGYNYKKYIINGYFTFSFWVYSSKTGTMCVSFGNNANNRSYVKETIINSANTWEKKIMTIPVDASGTWLTDENIGLYIAIALMAGTSYQGAANTWQAGTVLATSNQTNFMDSTSNVMYFSGFSCGAGTQEVGFDGYDYAKELLRLYRCYYRIDHGGLSGLLANLMGQSASGSLLRFKFHHCTKFRTAPTISTNESNLFNITTGSAVSCSLSSFTGIEVFNNEVKFIWNDTGIPFTTNNVYSMLMSSSYLEFDARF